MPQPGRKAWEFAAAGQRHFRQVESLGNISVAVLQHYVTNEGQVKLDRKVSDKDKAEAVSPIPTWCSWISS
jgi:hypothetical protein